MFKRYIALLFVLLTCSAYSQTIYVAGQIDGNWGPTHQMSTQTVNGVSYYYVTIQATGAYNPAAFLFEADGYYNKWNTISANKNTVSTYVWNANYAGTDNSISNGVVSGRYYTFRLKNNAYSSAPGVIMETVSAPITIDSVYAFPSSVSTNTAVTCSVKVSAQPGADSLFLVYSTDNFTTSTAVKVTNVDATSHIGTVQIPGQATNGLTVKFYALTSTIASSSWGTNRDLCAINYKENGASYYSYNIAPISTISDGNWSNPAIWNTGVIPTGGANVTIAHNVTLDTSVTLLSVTVNSGKTLTLSGATPKTLTMSTGGSITNNGTIAHGNGTVNFAGTGTVTGTVGFYNVNISGGLNFGSASTINGTIKINAGGYVSSNPPIYATGSTLQYNTGGSSAYGRYLEWNSTSGAGYPANVQISNNTTLVMGTNNQQAIASQISGNLIVDLGSKLSLDSTGYDLTTPFTVLGDVTVNGSLVLSNSGGGDLKTYGNISFGASSVFTPNARAIFFLKDGTQTVTHASGTITIPYLVIGRIGGSGTTVQLNGTHLISSAPNGGNSISFTNSTDILDLNGKDMTLGTVGQTSTISGSGTFKGNGVSSITSYGTGAGGTISFTAGSQVLSKLILNRTLSGSVILGSNVTINDTLKLISGNIDLNGKTITLGTNGFVSEVAGNTLGGTTGSITTTRTFGAGDLSSGVNIAGLGAKLTTTAALGSTVISRSPVAQTVNGSNSIKRFFDITPTINSSLNATLEFSYDSLNELNNITRSNLRLFKSTDSGSSWVLMGATTNDTANFKVILTGIQSFSRWTLGDVNAPVTSISAGNWSNAAIWSNNSVPTGGTSVTINTNVTVDTSVTVKNLVINSGKTLVANDGLGRTLTIASGGSITNNGTFTHGSGTVAFAGSGTVTGTVVFGTVTIGGGVDFGSASTINTALTLNPGGYVNTNPPTYATGSTLTYNSGTYIASNEWKTGITSGAGVPYNVTIASGKNLSFGTASAYRQMNGNLVIPANDTLFLSTVSGGDLKIKGNWTNNNTVVNKGLVDNGRAIFFNGSSIINNASGTATISHIIVDSTVTYNTDLSDSTIQINAGGRLISQAASAHTLTVLANGTFTNSGTFTANDGTVVFAGTGTISGTTALNNVSINAGLDFGSASTVNGTLLMNIHSFINANPPTYGSGSTLQYNTGSTYGRWLEWSDTTGKGYPANVKISNSTTVDLGNSGTGTVRRISGNLTIDAASTLSMNVNKMTSALTVNGNVINNGTVTLSDSVGGDLNVKGNFTNNGTLNHNSRSVRFNGTAAQQIDGTTSPITFGYLTINNSTGVTLAQNIKVKNTATLTSGKVALGNYDFILDTTATIGGTPSASAMLVTGGTGQVKKIYKSTGAFTFPVGDNTATAEYSPVTFTVNSGTFTQDTVGVIVTNALHPNVTATTDSLKRYWTVTSNGITSPNYSAQFSYTASDVAGREYKLFGQKWDGSAWTNTGAVDTANNRFTVSGITSLGSFTAADSVIGGAIHVNVKVIPQGYYNAGDYLNATDTIQVFLADANSPYAYIDSVSVLLDSLTFSAATTFNTTSSGSYYIVVKQRSSVETWSATAVLLTKGVTSSYDFTDAQTKAYGDNLVQVSSSPVRYAIYGGDVNQDGYVDPLDMSAIDLDSFNYASGVGLITDVNGDHFVDPLDMSITDLNSFNYVGIKRPVSAKSIKAHSRAPQGIHYQDLKKIVK